MTEGQKDYAGMREFQQKYIHADQECDALRAEVERLNSFVHLTSEDYGKLQKQSAERHELKAEVERLRVDHAEVQLLVREEERQRYDALRARLDEAVNALRSFCDKSTWDQETQSWGYPLDPDMGAVIGRMHAFLAREADA